MNQQQRIDGADFNRAICSLQLVMYSQVSGASVPYDQASRPNGISESHMISLVACTRHQEARSYTLRRNSSMRNPLRVNELEDLPLTIV